MKTTIPLPRPSPSRLMKRLDELGAVSSAEDGLTRLYLSEAHRRAAALVRGWMEQAGLETRIDDAGTVCGVLAGAPGNARRLLLGSHIDSVPRAGKFDGCLGVVAAIEAIDILASRGVRLPYAVEVLAFGDEEGVRFPVTLTGARAVAGTFSPASLAAVDADGITLERALRAFGCDPAGVALIGRQREDVFGYLELHIEQGPVLESEGLAVGVVTAISAAQRSMLEFAGKAGHAGTVPMRLRQDVFAALAELAVAIRAIALRQEGVVATIGMVDLPRGAVNVIPSQLRCSLDLRAASDALLAEASRAVAEAIAAASQAHGVGISQRVTYESPATTCAPGLQQAFAEAVARTGLAPRFLPSGAGHDGVALAARWPIGMLFVRCKGGVSHHPDEYVAAEDAQLATDILADTLTRLTG